MKIPEGYADGFSIMPIGGTRYGGPPRTLPAAGPPPEQIFRISGNGGNAGNGGDVFSVRPVIVDVPRPFSVPARIPAPVSRTPSIVADDCDDCGGDDVFSINSGSPSAARDATPPITESAKSFPWVLVVVLVVLGVLLGRR